MTVTPFLIFSPITFKQILSESAKKKKERESKRPCTEIFGLNIFEVNYSQPNVVPF